MANFFDQFDAPAAGGNFFDQFDPPSPEQPSVLGDVATSAGRGLAKFATGMAGAGGDAREWNANLINKASKAVGYELPTEGVSSVLRHVPLMDGPTTEQARNVAQSVTGPWGAAQTPAGEATERVAEFLPGMIGGPANLVRRAVTQVAAPALASLGAEKLTEGTAAEPYASGGAALLASVLAHKATAPNPGKVGPALGEVKQAATGGYEELRATNNGNPVPQQALDTIANDIRDTLNRSGARPSVADKIHAAVDELRVPATNGAPDVSDLVAARENIKGLLGSPDRNASGAVTALKKIDDAIERFSPGTMSKLKEADQNWSAVKTNEALDKKITRAELRAAGDNSGLNMGNKIKQKAADLLLSKEARYLSPENRKALEAVVRGTTTQSLVRFASNALGGGGGIGSTLLGLGTGAAGTYAGHPELAALPVVGIGSRMLYNRMVSRQAAGAAAGIRQRSPHGQKFMAAQGSPTLPSQSIPGLSYNNPTYRKPELSALESGLLSLLLAPRGVLPLLPSGQ